MKSSTFGLGLNDVWSGLNQWLIPQLIEVICDNFCHCRCSRVALAPTQSQSTIWRRTSLHALFGFGPNSGTESGTLELRCTDAKVSVMKTSSFLKRRLSHLTFDQAFWFSSFFFSRRTGEKRKFDRLKNRLFLNTFVSGNQNNAMASIRFLFFEKTGTFIYMMVHYQLEL